MRAEHGPLAISVSKSRFAALVVARSLNVVSQGARASPATRSYYTMKDTVVLAAAVVVACAWSVGEERTRHLAGFSLRRDTSC